MPGESQLYTGAKPVPPESMHFDYLSNGSTIHAVGNYATPESFRITCVSGSRKLHIYRMIVYWEDVGGAKSGKYGTDLVLANGIHVHAKDSEDALLQDLTGNNPVMTNAQWSGLCYDVVIDKYGSGQNGSLASRWTFNNAGAPISLSAGDYLEVELEDDYTGLVEHTFMIQGHYE